MKSFVLAAWALVMRDYRVRFRRTLFGMAWFLLPLFTLVGMALWMGKDLGLYTEGESKDYLVQLLAGLTFWQLLADAWLEPMRLARRANVILRAVNFNTSLLLGAGVVSALVAFILKLPVLIAALIWLKAPLTASLCWIPIGICGLVFAGMAMACFTLPISLALLDVRYAMPFVQYALLLATPIFYTAPDTGPIYWINHINPISYLIPPFRDILTGYSPEVYTVLVPFVLVSMLLGMAYSYFRAKIHLAIAYIGY